jgi:hypothetical protein
MVFNFQRLELTGGVTRTCHLTFAIAAHDTAGVIAHRSELKNQNIGHRQYGRESFGGDDFIRPQRTLFAAAFSTAQALVSAPPTQARIIHGSDSVTHRG